MRIFILTQTYANGQRIANEGGLAPNDWTHLTNPYQLMGHEKPRIVMGFMGDRRHNFIQIQAQADSRSAVWYTEFDLQEGRVR